MSEADRAQELEARDWEYNNRPRTPSRLFAPHEKGYGLAECSECGEDMPPLRRAMGREMCTDCTSAHERRGKIGVAA